MVKAPKQTGAESIRWDLSDLYASPTDPELEATMSRAMENALTFEAAYKGKVATLEPHEFAEIYEFYQTLAVESPLPLLLYHHPEFCPQLTPDGAPFPL